MPCYNIGTITQEGLRMKKVARNDLYWYVRQSNRLPDEYDSDGNGYYNIKEDVENGKPIQGDVVS